MAEPRTPNPRFSVTLPNGVPELLDEIARERGAGRASLIREAVLDWLRRQGRLKGAA